MVNYFQILPPLVFSYRLFFFSNRRKLSLKEVAGLFPPLIAGLIFLLLENSNNFDQRECGSLLTGPILWLAVEGERAFSFSSWNNAFVDEFCVWMRLFFCLCAPQGKVTGLDFGELRVRSTFSLPFPRLICVVAHLVWNASSLSLRFNTECSVTVPAQVLRKTVVRLYSHFCKIDYREQ